MIVRTLINLILFYKKQISPLYHQRCRFYPSCSDYMISAVSSKGVMFGLLFGMKRLLKCHPFHKGGVDMIGET